MRESKDFAGGTGHVKESHSGMCPPLSASGGCLEILKEGKVSCLNLYNICSVSDVIWTAELDRKMGKQEWSITELFAMLKRTWNELVNICVGIFVCIKGFNEQLYLKNLIKPSKAGLLWLRSEFSSLAVPEVYQLIRSYQRGCEGGDQVSSYVHPFPSAQDSFANIFYLIAAGSKQGGNEDVRQGSSARSCAVSRDL